MSWLRIDDGFADHPKLLELEPVDRWRWLELLCLVARYRTRGVIRAGFLRRLGIGEELLELLETLGLVDRAGDGELVVHDWDDYNRPLEAAADRQRRYRMRQAGVPEDEVVRAAPLRTDAGFRAPRNVTGDVTGDVAVAQSEASKPLRARVPHPLPLGISTPSTSDVGPARGSELPGAGLPAGSELLAARLLAAVNGELEPGQVDYVRGAVLRLPESVSAGLLELLAGGTVREPRRYVLSALASELRARGWA